MKYSAADYERRTGYEAMDDDLERMNCAKAGEIGHQQCGVCAEHDKPRFLCGCLAHEQEGK